MTLDQYQPCPGGLDKKIKFCCKDLVSDLDKITRSIEGEQYEAALHHIDRLLSKYPDRQCLWTLKVSVLIETGKYDLASSRNAEFLRIAPENPIALANSALLRMLTLSASPEDATRETRMRFDLQREQTLREAVATLHQALASCGNQMSHEVFQAIGFLGSEMIEVGHFQAGREHLLLQYAIAGSEAEDAVRTLLETASTPRIPALLKQETILPVPVDWVQWKEGYIAARELASRGAWTPAAEQVTQLIAQYETHPVLLRAQAILRCRLPDPKRAAAALRQLASCDDIPLDEAVEAEALAQIIDPPESDEFVDLLSLTYSIAEPDVLQEKLLASRQTHSLGVEGLTSKEEGPPPKAAFAIFDRDLPRTADQLTSETLPEILAECLLFGRQTDRDARLVLVITRNRLEQVHQILQDIAGEVLATATPEEQLLNRVPRIASELAVRPQFPPHTPYDVRVRLLSERRQKALTEHWIHLTNPALDNLTPAEAAGDPAYHRRLLGTILRLQQMDNQVQGGFDYDRLREVLNLPLPQPIHLRGEDLRRLPLVRLERLDPTDLNDQDLLTCFLRASQSSCNAAVLKLGTELTSRESVAEITKLAEIYGRMAEAADNLTRALELLHLAQTAAVKSGQSPATWMIPELSLRMIAGQVVESQELLNRIQSRHIREPGVAQMLMQTLQRLGVVTSDGKPVVATGTLRDEPSPGATAAGPVQRLWTPDGGTPSSPQQTEEPGKSQLWIPGMD